MGKRINYCEYFTIRNERVRRDNVEGFRAFNSFGEETGIVWMTKDSRSPFYECAEFYIYPKYRNKYGTWHKIETRGCKLPWKLLTSILEREKEYHLYID